MSILCSDGFKARANYNSAELRFWQSPVTSTTRPKTNSAKLKPKAYAWPLERINRGQLEGEVSGGKLSWRFPHSHSEILFNLSGILVLGSHHFISTPSPLYMLRMCRCPQGVVEDREMVNCEQYRW